MEPALRGLDGLKELTAVAAEGYAGIVLEFNIETDKDKVLADVRDKVDQAKADLPDEADEPVISETNFALQPTIIVTLSGDVPERTLTRHARRLKDEIEAISSVREATLSGNREELLEVVLDLMRMESYNITQDELLNALVQNNQLVAAGFMDDGNGRFNVKVPGLVETAKEEPIVELDLLLRATEKTWLRIQADSSEPWETTMKTGDEIRLKAVERVALFIGNAGGIRFELNGKRFGPLGTQGQVISNYVITKDNL